MLSVAENPWHSQQLERCSQPPPVPGLGTLCLRCQGYLRTEAGSVTPAVWLCNSLVQPELLSYLGKGREGERTDRYEMYSGGQGSVPISSIHEALNGLVPQTQSWARHNLALEGLILSLERRKVNQWEQCNRMPAEIG